MTKYAELCRVAETAVKNYNEYRDSAEMFAWKMVHGLKAYLGIPPETMRTIWATPHNEPQSTKYLHPTKAVKLDDDGYWAMRIVVRYRIGDSDERYVQEAYPLRFIRHGNGFKVEFAQNTFTVGIDDDLTPCFEAYYDDMRNLVNEGLFGTGAGGPPKIGFQTILSQPEKPAAETPI